MVYVYNLNSPQLTIGTLIDWFEEIVQEAVEQREVRRKMFGSNKAE
jgi:hypothetical protein